MLDAKECETGIGQPALGSLAKWVGEQLSDIGHDADGRLSDIEELINKGEQSTEK